MRITYITRTNKQHTITTNNINVYVLLALLGYRVVSSN